MIFLHLWKELAFLLGLSVDDLEILLAFQEKGPRYSKNTYNITIFQYKKTRTNLFLQEYWLVTSSDTNAGPKIFTLTLIHSKIGNLLQSKTQLHLLFGNCSTLKQFEILHSFRIILIIPFPYLTHFWCKCYLLCRCTHLESSSTIVFLLIF